MSTDTPPRTKLAGHLIKQLNISWQLLSYHLNDLSIEECLWQPAKKGIYLTQNEAGQWIGGFPESEGYDAGPTNIAWITWHIEFWWAMTLNHSFGDATLAVNDIQWQESLTDIKSRFEELKNNWVDKLANLTDDDWQSTRLSKWPIADCPFSDIAAWLNVELMKNAAEIGYIRFLYANRTV